MRPFAGGRTPPSMAVDPFGTRLRAISHNRIIGGYDGNPITFENRELRLIQRGLRQVIESFNGVDREGGGQTTIADVDPRGAIFVHPARFPTAIFLLEGKEGAEVHFVPDADGRASKDAHGESQGIAF